MNYVLRIARLEFAMEILQDSSDDRNVHRKIDAMRGDLFELNALVSELLNLAKTEQQLRVALRLSLWLKSLPWHVFKACHRCVKTCC